jgi:hypothetical protein
LIQSNENKKIKGIDKRELQKKNPSCCPRFPILFLQLPTKGTAKKKGNQQEY